MKLLIKKIVWNFSIAYATCGRGGYGTILPFQNYVRIMWCLTVHPPSSPPPQKSRSLNWISRKTSSFSSPIPNWLDHDHVGDCGRCPCKFMTFITFEPRESWMHTNWIVAMVQSWFSLEEIIQKYIRRSIFAFPKSSSTEKGSDITEWKSVLSP